MPSGTSSGSPSPGASSVTRSSCSSTPTAATRRKQAVRIGPRLVDAAPVISWFEEPVSSDDLEGLREVKDQLAFDVAAGEYGYDETYFARMSRRGAVDCLQIDVTRCGGLHVVASERPTSPAPQGLEVSAHCAPNLHAHVGYSVPHLRHVEYFHDHQRLDDACSSTGCSIPRAARLRPPRRCRGHGMALKKAVAATYRR